MTRLQDWERRLREYLDGYRVSPGTEVEWGRDDCGVWVSGAVRAACGIELKLPAYETHTQALRAIAVHGGLPGLVTSLLGEPTHPARLRVGDVAYDRETDALGIVMGRDTLYLGDGEYARWPTLGAAVGWRVG